MNTSESNKRNKSPGSFNTASTNVKDSKNSIKSNSNNRLPYVKKCNTPVSKISNSHIYSEERTFRSMNIGRKCSNDMNKSNSSKQEKYNKNDFITRYLLNKDNGNYSKFYMDKLTKGYIPMKKHQELKNNLKSKCDVKQNVVFPKDERRLSVLDIPADIQNENNNQLKGKTLSYFILANSE